LRKKEVFLKTFFRKKELTMEKTNRQLVGGLPREEAAKILGMMEDLTHKLRKGVLTPDELAKFLKKENPFETKMASKNKRPPNIVSPWISFYRDVFGIRTVFPGIKIPEKRDGFDRLLIIAEGMTSQKLYDKCAELFPLWKWIDRDLDEIVTSNRTAKNGAYAVWVRDRVEADEELKNLSANQLKERGVSGITLEERLIYELKYFNETGKHLDINNVTLCAGSRCRDGIVPDVGFDSGARGVGVHWANPEGRIDHLRSRQTVSA
jgi:hypothetical protein